MTTTAPLNYEKCSRVADGIVDLAAWELLAEGIAQDGFPERFADGAAHPLRTSAEILMEFAARLGSEWALASYVRNESRIKTLRDIDGSTVGGRDRRRARHSAARRHAESV